MTTSDAAGTLALLHALFGKTSGALPSLVPAAGRRSLATLLAALGVRTGAEIGVWRGGYAELLCRACRDLHLLAVDPWRTSPDYQEKKNDQRRLDDAYAEAQQRLAPFPHTVVRAPSIEAARLVPDASLDFIYIDANHREPFVRADLEAWSPKVRRGGIVAGHDYLPPSPKWPHIEVPAAVTAFTAAHRIDPWFVLAADERAPSYCWVVP
jgi:hypothetical protein